MRFKRGKVPGLGKFTRRIRDHRLFECHTVWWTIGGQRTLVAARALPMGKVAGNLETPCPMR